MQITETQIAQVNKQIKALLSAESFYGKKLEEAGVTSIQSAEDFQKLPFSEKNDLRNAYPLGLMTAPEEKIVRIHSSSGTTGLPVIIPYTQKDVDDWAVMFKRCYEMAGMTNMDRIQITPGYGLWTAGIGFQAGCEKQGAMAVPLVLSALLLKDRPERVMLTPASTALVVLLPLELFCDDMLFPLFVSLTLLSFTFLLTPCLRPCKRFGEFNRIPPELALKGFCLLEASGTTLALIPILFRARNWRLLADQGLFLLFLAVLYFGVLFR